MKRYVLILIILAILISIGIFFVVYENTDDVDNNIDNNIQTEELENIVEEVNNEVDVQEEILDDEEYIEVEYIELSSDIVRNLNEDETFEIFDIIDNKDGTVTVVFRKYVEIDVPVLTDEEYNLLMENKEIELFGERFVLENDTVLTNHNFVSFEFDENNNLIPYAGTYFCKGTDVYYAKIVSSDLTIDILPNETSKTILEYTSEFGSFDYLNIGAFWTYRFDEEDNLVGAEITW